MKRIWENTTSSYKNAEFFDRKFWRSAGASARFAAAWSMVYELWKTKGYPAKPRLRRSVQSIERLQD
ncbi:MAG: hypothetical protein HY747_00685 [Elusimicrobia bacterium]|nr:hypothetical protein [Elusimicrobiota bacterium]